MILLFGDLQIRTSKLNQKIAGICNFKSRIKLSTVFKNFVVVAVLLLLDVQVGQVGEEHLKPLVKTVKR